MRSPHDVLKDIEVASMRLIEGSRGLVSWEWENRYSAALATVLSPRDEEILLLLRLVFPNSWNHLDYKWGPETVRTQCGIWGGLLTDQLFFTLHPADDPLFFAAWWPWASRKKFSLRVSCAPRSAEAVATDPQALLRDWFAI